MLGIGSAPEFLDRLMWNKFPKKIKNEIIKEDTMYRIVAGSDEKSIVNGDSFKNSEVKNDD